MAQRNRSRTAACLLSQRCASSPMGGRSISQQLSRIRLSPSSDVSCQCHPATLPSIRAGEEPAMPPRLPTVSAPGPAIPSSLDTCGFPAAADQCPRLGGLREHRVRSCGPGGHSPEPASPEPRCPRSVLPQSPQEVTWALFQVSELQSLAPGHFLHPHSVTAASAHRSPGLPPAGPSSHT